MNNYYNNKGKSRLRTLQPDTVLEPGFCRVNLVLAGTLKALATQECNRAPCRVLVKDGKRLTTPIIIQPWEQEVKM